MTPERWRQVDRILEEVLELPPDERVRFLDRMCAGDHALRRDVEAVLQAHGNAGTFLNDPAFALAAKQLAVDEGNNLVGRTLGHYRILSLIGAGGMGEVYRASDPRLGREVAVKVLPEHLAKNPEALSRFEREAKVVAALSHPNILAIHDVGEEQGIRYAVMEFLDGETLRDLLNQSPLGWREAVTIGAAIADGLAAAHAKEIVHRDLKPENIFRTSDGRIKILDFGLARRRPSLPLLVDGSPTAGALTEPWMVLGTVGYMSPEQIRGEEADAPSDIFSFGCVLYEMVTGKRAYARQTTAETMAAIVQGELPDTGELSQRAAPELEQLIVRCLQKDPASRYPSARNLYHDLNALLGRSQMQRPATHVREIRSKWARWTVASAAIVLAFVFGYAWWRNTNRSPLNVEKQRLVFTAPGTYGAASFSPDCGMITYTQTVDGIPQVFVKNLSSGDPIQITFAEAANRPQWSPRNDQIVLSAGPIGPAGAAAIYRDQNIWSVPPLGGTPRKLIEGGVNANWSRDGSKLVFERGTEIWIADSDGTNQHKVDGIPPIGDLRRDRMPSLSPDGSLIAYFQVTTSGVLGDFWVIPAAGGQPRQLTSDIAVGRSPAWSPDGRYVVFASERGGSLTLWKVPVTGGPPEPMLSGAGDDSDPGICGDRLVYRHTRQAYVLTLLDPLTSKTRELRSSTNEIVAPSFSPNGDGIAFFSHENDGEIHLFTIQPDGGKLTRITSGKGEQNTFPQWSADGAYLFYYQARPVRSYRKIPTTGGQSIEIEHGWHWGVQNAAQVDPTGERLVYSLTQESGDRTGLVRYLNSEKEEKLDVGLSNIRWSHDGKSVLGYHRVPGRRDGDILICPAKPGTCEQLTSGYMPRWSYDDSIIYFLRFNKFSDGGDLYRIHRKTRVETRVAELRPLAANGNQYDISPQGEVVYVQYNSGVQELWLADLKP
jgi:eukaryotic-like serine/threonine-protein kinase